MWRALPSFRGNASLKTFVYRIAHNRGLSHGWVESKKPKDSEDVDGLLDVRPSPEVDAARRQEAARLYAAIRELPLLSRQVITLRLEGLAFSEIAEIMGETENNVTVRASRARKKLRQLLGESEGAEA